MKFIFLQLLILFLSVNVFSQTDVKISKKEFRTDKPGLRAAWKHVKLGNANYLSGGQGYSNSYSEYQQAYVYNSGNAQLNYKLGISALYSDKREDAADYLNKAYEIKKDVADDILLYMGRAAFYQGKYSAAIDTINNYLKLPGKKPRMNIARAKKYIEECNAALAVTKDTLRVEINNIGANINSSADDYSEVLASGGKKMLFASRRGTSPDEKSIYSDNKFNENIYSSDLVDGAWTVATLFNKNLTTKYCEVPLFMNDKGDKLYIYAGYEGGGDIKVSVLKRNKWKSPAPVRFNINSKNEESSFTMSHKGNKIAFVSDRKKGLGGKDIYIMTRKTSGKWSRPQNPGPVINTKYDEESVRFSAGDDTLWFGSKGHNSMGGFDIFYSTISPEGKWSEAFNAGYPVNTQWDDLFYCPSPGNDSSFYLITNRKGGYGGLDIFKGRYLPPPPSKPVEVPVVVPPPAPVPKRDTVIIIRDTVVVVKEVKPVAVPEPPKEKDLFLEGKVTDSETKEPVLARLEIFDMSNDQVVATTASSDVDGTYRVKLPGKKSYMVSLRATGFLSGMERVAISDSYTQESYKLDISLTKVKVGKKVVLNNILFEQGKAVITKSSTPELEKLLAAMQDNPNMKIEVSGHTDNTGSAIINAKLSSDRAKAIVDYLVKNGIDSGRMTFAGYGPDQPVADNSTPAGRAKNRRVEFKITGI
jgi:outer membrane protein OmpA-like peptidoglycan-associated protein